MNFQNITKQEKTRICVFSLLIIEQETFLSSYLDAALFPVVTRLKERRDDKSIVKNNIYILSEIAD